MDLNFYIVSVQRLREVARHLRDRLGIQSVRRALQSFDTRWPCFRNLRNLEEHVLGPTGDHPLGIWYFRHGVADLKPEGRVEFVVHLESMEASVDELFQAICEALETEAA